jgi:hypothetical protein
MRKLIVGSVLALGVIVAACDQAADTPTSPPQPGTGHYLLADSTVSASAQGGGKATTADGSTYHFAFAADVEDGSTKGNAMLRIGSTRYNADVVCLGVRGDTAAIVGVVRSSSDPGAVGDSLVFTAIDGSDRIGEPEFPAAGQAGARCASVTPGATLAVDAGQVKVSGSTFTGPVVVGTVVGMGSYVSAGEPNTFQTNVTRLSDGTVSGEYREDNLVGGEFLVLTVSCVNLVGDTAYIGGTITSGSFFVGTQRGVIVVDNAPSTDPDQSSGIRSLVGSAQDFCDTTPAKFMNDLTSGDIAITP